MASHFEMRFPFAQGMLRGFQRWRQVACAFMKTKEGRELETAKERYERAAEELASVCRDAGRDPESVKLVAVSKTVGAAEVECALQGGAANFGENRPDQLMEKADRFPEAAWHFIGNIQSRRIRDIVGRATLIHSLFQESHARKIDEVAREMGIVQDVLVEVNVSGEESKSGVTPEEAPNLVRLCTELGNVRVCGLMTMAPQGDAEVARSTFAGLARLKEELREHMSPSDAVAFTELSMGMSDDWREAVEEGATIVRIGRAIFSDSFKVHE